MNDPIRIAVVGSGYVGLVAAACFAELGYLVTCVDNDLRKIAALQAGDCPIHEEHLPALVHKHLGSNLYFTYDLGDAIHGADAVFIAVGTPPSETGKADLSYVEAVANEIARSITHYTVIVEKSTVPVYTSEWICRVIQRNGVPRNLFDVVSNPEFLREGTAVRDFLHPDRIVIGADHARPLAVLSKIYEPLTKGTYYGTLNAIEGPHSPDQPPPLVSTSTKSAEIIKHASNAFLALKISFINSVANLCEATHADISQVARGMGLDSRIGPKFLQPGIGYGGSCFPKDVAAFRHIAEQLGIDFSLLTEVERINTGQKRRFIGKLRSVLWTLRGKRIGVLGLAFKGGTDDIRESPAIDIVRQLIAEGCSVQAFDPAAMARTAEALPEMSRLRYTADEYAAAQNADAVLILTDWTEFGNLDLQRLKTTMRCSIIVDGRNLYDPDVMRTSGITYVSVGRPIVDFIEEPVPLARLA
jgi:UDPglucose 6-dehydrogenase